VRGGLQVYIVPRVERLQDERYRDTTATDRQRRHKLHTATSRALLAETPHTKGAAGEREARGLRKKLDPGGQKSLRRSNHE